MFKNTSNYRNKIILLSVIQVLLLLAVLVWSVITGQYPLTLKSLLSGDTMSIMVFKRLRLPRALMGVIGGFGLSISGYIYQLIFKNPLASPDIVGVSSGASAGAALAKAAQESSSSVKENQNIQLGLGDVASWTDAQGVTHHVDSDGMDRYTAKGSSQVQYQDWSGQLPSNAVVSHH